MPNIFSFPFGLHCEDTRPLQEELYRIQSRVTIINVDAMRIF
jgi:hypothetical protein